jgi:hypothetical protein
LLLLFIVAVGLPQSLVVGCCPLSLLLFIALPFGCCCHFLPLLFVVVKMIVALFVVCLVVFV